MADLSSCFTSPKEEKKKKTLPDSSTTSDVDTDAILNDSDYGELYANEVSDKTHLTTPSEKKNLKPKAFVKRRKRRKHSQTF